MVSSISWSNSGTNVLTTDGCRTLRVWATRQTPQHLLSSNVAAWG